VRAAVAARLAARLATRARRVRALTRAECRAELLAERALLAERGRAEGDELRALEGELGRTRSAVPVADEEALQRTLASDLEVLLAAREPRAALDAVLERERSRRARAVAAARAEERARTDLLARRLAKLRAAQVRTEQALAELARGAELDHGLPSLYRSVQGLGLDALEREAKAKLLACIFAANVALQRRGA
jgi:hypothetical protein